MDEKGKIKILVVDDDALFRSLIYDILSRKGFEVETATNGKEALGLLRSKNYALLISDLNMPEMGGLELLHAVRNEKDTKGMLILLMSGVFDEEALKIIKPAKTIDYSIGYIEKPFGAAELINKVKEFIKLNNLRGI